jgi:hypothetical protein
MSVKLQWINDPSVPVSSFVITLSTDKGQTFSALVTIPFNTAPAAPNYDPRLRQFFYTDLTGVPGNIYRIVANGANGTSIAEFAIAPPLAYPMCQIYSNIVDAFGEVDQSRHILVRSFGTRGEKWTNSPPGIVAYNPMALGIVDSVRTVFSDLTGLWQVSLIQGTYARIEIPDLQYSWAFMVPNEVGPVNIRDIPALRGSALGIYPEMMGDRDPLVES